MSGAERRQHPRTPAIVKVSYDSAATLRADFTQNISTGGLFVETDRELEMDQTVELHLSCPGTTGTIPVRGIVRWKGEHPPGPGLPPVTGVGLEFDMTDAVQRARLEQMIAAAMDPIPPSLTGERLNILVVDPNRHARTLFKAGLESMGRETFDVDSYVVVLEAADGGTALRYLRSTRVSLVMVELNTPDVDGTEIIRRIRTEFSQTLPVFAMSRPFPGDKADALAAGADMFLQKPLQLRPLFNTLKIMLKLD